MPANKPPTGIRAGSAYWASLDGVRGIFMITIFLYHCDATLLLGAGISVDAFFVMSAFLITVLLVREHERTGRIDLIAFYRRRVLRLFPAMYVIVPIAAVAAYGLIPARRHDVIPSALSTLFYYANFRAAYHPLNMAVFLPTWSLSTEEQFYVVWSSLLLALLALRTKPRVLVSLVGGLCVLAAWWLQHEYNRGTALSEIAYRPDLRVIGILVGTFVGLLYVYGMVGDRARTPVRMLTVAGTLFVAFYLREPLDFPKDTIVTMCVVAACVTFGALVLQQVRWPLAPYSLVLEARPVVWIGRASYVLYLVHVPILRCQIALIGDQSAAVRILLCGSLTLAVGWVVHEYVEKPALRLKTRRAATAELG